MGCFNSSLEQEDLFPNERTRLLDQESMEIGKKHSEAEILRKQAEALNVIVQRAADNLIDISSANMIDKLQSQETHERENEYASFLQDYKWPQQNHVISKRYSTLHSNENIDEQITKKDEEQINAFKVEIARILKECKIPSVGSFVVSSLHGN
jgi:hypothetical protein